jgi:hypothetical protein
MNARSCLRMTVFSMPVALVFAVLFALPDPSLVAGGSMMDYYLPMPMYQNRLESTGVWGVKNVVPRDIYNGIEDSSCKKYSYWDGKIIKGKDGKFHLYCSRWDQSAGHNGWQGSTAVHAVSDSITGPYIDKGPLYTWNGGKGHNVTALILPDGRIAVSVSEIVPLTIFTASDPNGPFTQLGAVQINTNGHNTGGAVLSSNWTFCMRDDSTYLAVCRDGYVMLSKNGILGPYLVQTDKIWPSTLAGYNTSTWEDPVLWHSGKKYYCTVNSWASKKAIYLTSDDGITNWKYGGEAYSPLNKTFLRYTNGTKNVWCKMERPNVYVENNILKYLTFAVIDTEKEADFGNDNHNSKVIVAPFNGRAFDGDTITTAVQSGTTGGNSIKTASLIGNNAGKTWIIRSKAIGGAEIIDEMKVYDLNGGLVARIGGVSVSGGKISIDPDYSGPKPGAGMYPVTLRFGHRYMQGRLTVQ